GAAGFRRAVVPGAHGRSRAGHGVGRSPRRVAAERRPHGAEPRQGGGRLAVVLGVTDVRARGGAPEMTGRRGCGLALALTLTVALAPAAARAHTEPYSHLEIHVGPEGMTGTITAHMVDLAHEAGLAVPESLLDARYD